MKKWISLWAVAFLVSTAAFAEMSIILIYKGQDDITGGHPWIGTQTADGVLLTADQAMEANLSPILGTLAGQLFESDLQRLDKKVNTAVFDFGKPIKHNLLIDAHRRNVEAFTGVVSSSVIKGADTLLEEEPENWFVVKFNDQDVREGLVELPVHHKKSKFVLNFAVPVSTRIWTVHIKLKSEPLVSFRRAAHSRNAQESPKRTWRYTHQAIFKALRRNRSFNVSVEVLYIKKENYVFTLEVKTKEMGSETIGIPIKFVPRGKKE